MKLSFSKSKFIAAVLLYVSFCFLPCIAQTHLKFEGIAIDGTISDFSKKLSYKGFKIDKYETSRVPNGQKVFIGIFRSRKAKVTTFYNRKTSLVYKLKVDISFAKLNDAQFFLDKSLKTIEKTCIYIPEHCYDNDKNPQYAYHIYSNNKTNEIGAIIVNPTSLYTIDNSINKVTDIKPLIEYSYIDKVNTEKLTPSSEEPSTPIGFMLYYKDFFEKSVTYASNYIKSGCFGKGAYFLEQALSCYIHNSGVPAYFANKEQDIEDAIQRCRSYALKPSYSPYYKLFPINKYVRINAFRLTRNNNDENFEGIVIEEKNENFIKLNRTQIATAIEVIKKCIDRYRYKSSSLSSKDKTNFFKEHVGLSLSAYIGKEGNLREISWKEKKLDIYYGYNDNCGLKIDIMSPDSDYIPIFQFPSINELEEFVNVLQTGLNY